MLQEEPIEAVAYMSRPRDRARLPQYAAWLIICISVAMWHDRPAQAQNAKDEAAQLKEVIVTARFREEKTSDVGASISALSGSEIQQSGLQDFSDIAHRVPDLSFAYRGPNQNEIAIRGITRTALLTDARPAPPVVGIYVDDISIASHAGSQRDVPLYDLSRVEILRGPQGTLFGEGSEGGTIRYFSADPSLVGYYNHAGGELSDTAHGGLNYMANATLSAPVIQERAGVRLTGWYRDDSGFIDYQVPQVKRGNRYWDYGTRLVTLIRATDRLSIRLFASGEHNYTYGNWIASAPVSHLTNSVYPFVGGGPETDWLAGAKLVYQLDGITLNGITGFYERDMERVSYNRANSLIFGGVVTYTYPLKDRNWSEELRAFSSWNGPVNFAGGLYFKNHTFVDLLDIEGDAATYIPRYGRTQLAAGGTIETGRQWAAFGELYYKPFDRLTLTAGVRYFSDNLHFVVTQDGPNISHPAPTAVVPIDRVISKALPKAEAEYRLVKSTLLYAIVSEGAKNGGINSPFSVSQLPAVQQQAAEKYGPDSVIAYEVGLKGDFFDHRMTTTVDAFYNSWRDMQLELLTPSNGVYTQNSGAAHTKGVEAEADFKPIPDLRLYAAGNITQAVIDSAVHLGGRGGTQVITAGTRLPQVPTTKVSVGMEGQAGITDNLGLIYGVDYNRTGGARNQITVINAPPGFMNTVDPYQLVDVRVGVQASNWDVALFCSNVFNTISVIQYDPSSYDRYVNRPRVVGIRFNESF